MDREGVRELLLRQRGGNLGPDAEEFLDALLPEVRQRCPKVHKSSTQALPITPFRFPAIVPIAHAILIAIFNSLHDIRPYIVTLES